MGRDHTREILGRLRQRNWLSRRHLPAVLLGVAVAGYFAFQLASLQLFPNHWNARARVLNRDQVGWAAIGWDGVLPSELAVLGVPCALHVTEVAPNGPADKAGLKLDDYIVGLNGQSFADVLEFQGNTSGFRPGETITLNVARENESLAIPITLATWSEIEGLKISAVGL